jgi:hypothetical protein
LPQSPPLACQATAQAQLIRNGRQEDAPDHSLAGNRIAPTMSRH